MEWLVDMQVASRGCDSPAVLYAYIPLNWVLQRRQGTALDDGGRWRTTVEEGSSAVEGCSGVDDGCGQWR